jgi:hypothetical protein
LTTLLYLISVRNQVATLKFIAAHTSVPVPKVYDWNADQTNPVGAEYMIIEKVRQHLLVPCSYI